MKSLEKRIAENIIKRRKELSLTQVELSKKADLTQGMISEIERGNKSNYTINTLEKMAKALEVDVSDLVQDVEFINMTTKQKVNSIHKLSESKKQVFDVLLQALLSEEKSQVINDK